MKVATTNKQPFEFLMLLSSMWLSLLVIVIHITWSKSMFRKNSGILSRNLGQTVSKKKILALLSWKEIHLCYNIIIMRKNFKRGKNWMVKEGKEEKVGSIIHRRLSAKYKSCFLFMHLIKFLEPDTKYFSQNHDCLETI